MEDNITFDPSKIKVVEISEVRPNPWNPSEENSEEYQKILQSLKTYGQRELIVVREKDGYEIVDGEQRYKACLELGFKKLIVYNEGEIDDKLAKELMIWYKVHVAFSKSKLTELLKDSLANFPDMNLPFSDKEIKDLGVMVEKASKDMAKTKLNAMPESNEVKTDMRTLMVAMPLDQYNIVKQAIDRVKEDLADPNVTDGRALEFICVEFLNMPDGTTGK